MSLPGGPDSRLRKQKSPACAGLSKAGATGLEPATSGVTGRRSNQLNYAPAGGGQCSRAERRGVRLDEGDRERLGRTRVCPSVHGAAVVDGAYGDRRDTDREQRGRVGERAVGSDRGLDCEE